MNKVIALLTIASLCGCASRTDKLTTSKILVVNGTNRVEITQPKDTIIEDAMLGPDGVFRIKGYASAANAQAIKSNEAQNQMLQGLLLQNVNMLQQFGILAARAYGAPTGNLPNTSTNK